MIWIWCMEGTLEIGRMCEMLLDICRYHVVGALVLECTVIYYTEGRIRVPGLSHATTPFDLMR